MPLHGATGTAATRDVRSGAPRATTSGTGPTGWYNDPFHLADTVEALLQADHQLVAR
ncbi:MAG: hypothetical protein ACYDH5_19425 [Acidimicrobiales bacterium]